MSAPTFMQFTRSFLHHCLSRLSADCLGYWATTDDAVPGFIVCADSFVRASKGRMNRHTIFAQAEQLGVMSATLSPGPRKAQWRPQKLPSYVLDDVERQTTT